MYKYFCLNPISPVGLEKFSDDYVPAGEMAGADAVLVRSAGMHELEFDKDLKAIARAGAGVNNIPLDKCAEQGIVVFNTPGANANGVKELVIAGMLLASRDILGGINWVQENEEDGNIAKDAEKAKKAFAGCEIQGKKLGVIGLGAIGVLVANAATHLGMEVYGYDPYVSVDSAWRLSRSIHHTKNVDEIYKECDYITIHVPALEDTKGMINKNAISLMKEGVVILNFARDVLVNSEDIVDALVGGKVGRYVTDFPTPEIAGVSSFCGAASALNAEYTLPGISQSVVITRMAGRTPVPEKESIESFAAHQATMVIFLSTGMLEELSKRLIEGGYQPETPAAIVYKATWEDEKVCRCKVKDLAVTAKENGITKTALIVVGEVLGGEYERSLLYHPEFTTEFRQGKGKEGAGNV